MSRGENGSSSEVSRLVERVRDLGIELFEEDGRLRFRGPQGVLTAELREELAAARSEVLGHLRSESPTRSGPDSRSGGGTHPLGIAQERIWLFQQLEPSSTVYNLPAVVELSGVVDADSIEAAIRRVVQRQTALRSIIEQGSGGPELRIVPVPDELLHVEDLRSSGTEAHAALGAIVTRERGAAFDLALDIPFRARLVVHGEGHAHLVLVFHHVAADAASIGVFFQDLMRALDGHALGPLASGYGDLARLERAHWSEDLLRAEADWWREYLKDAPQVTEIPPDRPRPAAQAFRGGRVSRILPSGTVVALQDLLVAERATRFMALFAALGSTVCEESGLRDLVLGAPVAGRTRPESAGVVGMFVNQLPLRIGVRAGATFRELLQTARERALAAFDHQEMPFPALLEALDPPRDASRTPLFQMMLNVLPAMGEGQVAEAGGTRIAAASSEVGRDAFDQASKFDLTLYGSEQSDGFHLDLVYNAELFEPDRMARLLDRVLETLKVGTASPDVVLYSALSQPAAPGWVGALGAGAPDTVPARVAELARTSPDAVALADRDGREVTYAELARHMARIATEVRKGVAPDAAVAVMVPHGVDAAIAVCGVLASGRTYVPIDPDYPSKRVAYMLADTKAGVVLTVGTLVQRVQEWVPGKVAVMDVGPILASEPGQGEAFAAPDADSIAYLLYTSGSTGRSKAVEQTHGNLARHAQRYADLMKFDPTDRVALTASMSFDASLMDLFGGLVAGATVIPLDLRTLDLADLPTVTRDLAVSTLHLTPTVFRTVSSVTHDSSFHHVRVLVLGGEQMRPSEVEAFDTRFAPGADLLNLYGAAEHSLAFACAVARGRGRASAEVPLGWPVDDVEAVLIGSDDQRDPVIGELVLVSRRNALGYRDRDEETADRFSEPDALGRTHYRTGDLVRRRSDGSYVHLGRVDQQVKVRGHRIEPAEVESALVAHSSVVEAAVHAPEDADGIPTLTACVVLRGGDDSGLAAIGEWCRARLPGFMVPTGWVVVDVLPRTPTGKIDRSSLPVGRSVVGRSDAGRQRPVSSSEGAILGIAQEVLGVEGLGPDDDLFSSGAHSLSMVKIVARIRSVLDIDLELRIAFEEPTVAALARAADQARRSSLPSIEASDGEPARASFAQERMWFLQQISPDDTGYNLAVARRIEHSVDVERLREAVRAVARRHTLLHSVLRSKDGRPYLLFDEEAAPEVRVLEVPADDPSQVVEALSAGLFEPYDLEHGPLMRVVVAHVSDSETLFGLGVHHCVADNASFALLDWEIATVYEDRALSALPSLRVQYADFARWQRTVFEGDRLSTEVDFWRKRLEGLQPLDLPTDYPRPVVYRGEGDETSRDLPVDLMARIRALGAAHGATPFMVLLAAQTIALKARTGQDDIAVGVPTAHRTHHELEGLIGPFINSVVHRNDLSGDPTFLELLSRVRTTALEALRYQNLPFEVLIRELGVERDASRPPLFQVLFNVLHHDETGSVMQDAHRVPLGRRAAPLELALTILLDGDVGRARLDYNDSLFRAETADHVLEHFVRILERAVDDPTRSVSDLVAVVETDRTRLIDTWNRTDMALPDVPSFVDLIAARATESPDRVAVKASDGAYTYAELVSRGGSIAAALRDLGAGPGERVGVLMDRGRDTIASLLGVLGTGAAYVPLDPSYPVPRLDYMLADAKAVALVTDADTPEVGSSHSIGRLRLGTDPLPDPIDFVPVGAADPAYLIYTSGSTGKPKGVVVPHGAVLNLLTSMAREPGFEADDILLAVTTISFDISALELFLPLTQGATVVLADPRDVVDGHRLAELLESEAVTVFQATPATWKLLLSAGWTGREGLKALCGGEALAPELARELLPRTGELWNMYGPTETTVWSTTWRVDHPDSILIGRPIGNTTTYVLDREGRLTPVGVPGELFIGGAGVTLGYHQRRALTEERFVRNPFHPGGRMYRTGDLVRLTHDGVIEHLGRLDDQVKIRGFRIELGEIESVLRLMPEVADAVVATRAERLVAYVRFRDDPLTATEVRRALRGQLPEYMVPALVVPMDEFPLTPNGKTDRKNLPDPFAKGVTRTKEYVPPASESARGLAEVWADLLEVDRVGETDNFFELGGHSLLAMQVVSRVEARLGRRIDPRSLFFQTLGQIAAWLDQADGETPTNPIRSGLP